MKCALIILNRFFTYSEDFPGELIRKNDIFWQHQSLSLWAKLFIRIALRQVLCQTTNKQNRY